ncbi:YutD family protein [Paenibacillus sp. BC26]|uniref:YutD family protein n=1 Tax=Paenibacillus sp. BC26 TaxID=1881032 RepID=UPI0008F2086E|nr:YutD family protein [Paenibacillus sp. BC26]SFS47165.1 Protein of unknown function [Paenibacillus sp. BC26]
MIHISGRTYELIHENRNGWNFEAFRERFSEVLERYDYVIGDWGYNQLRLKGFFRDNHPKVTRESAFSSMTDYINEYCNFGCAYFVLEKQPGGAKSGEDGDMTEDHDGEAYETADGVEAYVTASRAVAAGQAADAPVSEHQQVKFMPRHERDQRREQQRNSNRKDAAKDPEKETPREGRKPFNKDREHGKPAARNNQNDRSERGERHERGDRGERNNERSDRGGEQRSERNERPDRPERNRNKRPHFNQKAPVAAASENPSHPPQGRGGKDQSPKH